MKRIVFRALAFLLVNVFSVSQALAEVKLPCSLGYAPKAGKC